MRSAARLGTKLVKKEAGSEPTSFAVTISVNGVMLAVAVNPVPAATLCSVPLPSGLGTSKTQGKVPLVIVS